MTTVQTPDPELIIRAAFDAGDFDKAATETLKAYGMQMTTFIRSRLRQLDLAQDAFSIFAEAFWVGLPAFEWRCSMRTWCYKLARSATARCLRAPHQRAERNLSLTSPGLEEMIAALNPTRQATFECQKTEVKDRVRALREQLDLEDQTLLVLRVERNLGWRDLAIAMSDEELSGPELEREAARLRKVFARVKIELRRLAANPTP